MAFPINLDQDAPDERTRPQTGWAYELRDRWRHATAQCCCCGEFGRSRLISRCSSLPDASGAAGFACSRTKHWNDLQVSGREFILGYGVAVAVAIPLGLAVGLSKRLQYMLSPFVDTLNAVPRVTLLPLIVIWFGIGIWSKVMVVFLGAVIPILINTQAGVKTSEARFIRVARSFSASKIKIFSSIILPGTVPFIFTGLKYGAGRALLGVVVGELYASTAGLGHMIAEAGNTFQTDVVFFGVLIFMATGLVVVAFLDAFERRFEKWRPDLH
jgi:NitT/TauT family transport system permease protein